MSDTGASPSKNRLIRMCREFELSLAASRPTLFHHMQPYTFEPPGDEVVKQWARIAATGGHQDRRSHMILSFDRFTSWPKRWRRVQHVFTGPPDALSDLVKFSEIASHALEATQSFIKDENIEISLLNRKIRFDKTTSYNADLHWLLACYNLAWDRPDLLNYRVEGTSIPSDKSLSRPGPPRCPFTDRRSCDGR